MRGQPKHARPVKNNFENLETFDGEGNGVASAEAECGNAALQVAALQFVEQRNKDASPDAHQASGVASVISRMISRAAASSEGRTK